MSADLLTEPRTTPGPSTVERTTIVTWIALAVGAGALRLLLIDRVPLSETEASYALRAWEAMRGVLDTSLAASGAPLFAHAMALLFFVFGPSDAAARAFPAVAGAALAVTPALLTGAIGKRAALLTGLLLAISPVAVQVSRMADPAMLTALLVMIVVASVLRLATDRPWWAPWTLAVGAGLSLADEPGVVVGLGTAALAAAATWGWSPRRWAQGLSERLSTGEVSALRGPVLAALVVALVAGTGAAMDLSGAGFTLGELWGGVGRILTPAPFPTRNLMAVLAYAWPILALAAFGFVRGVRAGDRLALFLGQWGLLLLALCAVVGQSALVLAILPLLPAALLAGIVLSRLAPESAQLPSNGAVYGAALLLLLIAGAVTIAVGYSIGANRWPGAPIVVGIAVLVLVTLLVWRSWLGREDVKPALAVFAVIASGALTVGSIGRFSFGGSPVASEPLPREITHPAVREAFHDLRILSSADPALVLVVDSRTPLVVRWYGRDIPRLESPRSIPGRAIVVREATGDASSTGGAPLRTPLKTTSILNRSELNLLGIARWAVARGSLVQGKTSDIIISR